VNKSDIRKEFDYTKDGCLLRRSTNKITGTIDSSGYKRTKYKRKVELCHRLIYIWHHGEIPEDFAVDHIDHDRNNNRIENLQLITYRENAAKKRKQKEFHAYQTRDGWRVKITVYTKKCSTKEEAIKEAYRIKNNCV
jgi:hypothetical protein